MECPYCLEEIKDGAVVCPYCGRDLSAFKLIKPALDRLSALENRVGSLEAQMSEPTPYTETQRIAKQPTQPSGVESNQKRRRALPSFVVALVAGAVPVCTPLGALVLLGLLGPNIFGWISFAIVLLVAPFLAGGAAGFVWWGRHSRAYVLYGLIVGVLAPVLVMLVLAVVDEEMGLGLYIVVGFSMATLFVSGILFGDLHEKRRRWRATGGPTQREMSDLSAQPVARLARVSGSGNLSPSTTLFIQALGPAIIGAMGTVATTIITFYLTEGG